MRADQRARRDAFLAKTRTRPVVIGILSARLAQEAEGEVNLIFRSNNSDFDVELCDVRAQAAPVAWQERRKRQRNANTMPRWL